MDTATMKSNFRTVYDFTYAVVFPEGEEKSAELAGEINAKICQLLDSLKHPYQAVSPEHIITEVEE